MDDFWLTILIVFLFTFLVNTVGISSLSSKLISLYLFIGNRAEYKAYRKAFQTLREARSTLSRISAQDEFAKWARQQRLVDKLQNEFDSLHGARQRAMITRQMAVGLAIRVIIYGSVGVWVISAVLGKKAVTGMSLDYQLLGPLCRLFSFPNVPNDQLSMVSLFFTSHFAMAHLLSSFSFSNSNGSSS